MSKSADAFRTISEVADWLDTPAHVLRFWESKFSQIKPVKRAGGRRYYRPADMMLVGGIKKLLHDDGLTIKGAQKILREQGVKHVAALSIPVEEDDDSFEVDTVVATPSDEPDLENVTIEVPAEQDEPEANVLRFQRDETPTQNDQTAVQNTAEVDSATPDSGDLEGALGPVEPAPEITTPAETGALATADPVAAPDPADLPTVSTPDFQNAAQSTPPAGDAILGSLEDSQSQSSLFEADTAEQTATPMTSDHAALEQSAQDTVPSVDAEDMPSTESFSAPQPATETLPDSSLEPIVDSGSQTTKTTEAIASDAADAPLFQRRASPSENAAPEEKPHMPAIPQDTPSVEVPNKDVPDLATGTAPEPTPSETPETAAPPAPRPNIVSVPDDPSDNMEGGVPIAPSTLHILGALARKTDRFDSAQAAQLAPLLDRLQTLQAKMLAQRKD
ncbi:MAG: MerR family transcriptional regulator [Rhodobacterales bacterium]|nr:MerR family transcriptional regulator [Rhodobacterales bacterium]